MQIRAFQTNFLSRKKLLIGVLMAVMAVPSLVQADLEGPQRMQRYVTMAVNRLLRKEHLSRRALDDEISQRALDNYIESLDPMKLFFLKSDVDNLSRYQNSIDELVASGNIQIAYEIFNKFLERVDERLAEVQVIIDEDHDFTLDEQLETDVENMDFPTTPEEARERWRKRIKYELLVRKTDDMTMEEAREKLHRRYSFLGKRRHQTDHDEVLEMFLTAISSSFDPHTQYMSPSNHENFEINMRLNLDGIGAALKPEDGYTVVTKVIPGGAADKHGKIKPEDKIISVGQETGEMVDVIDMKLNDVVHMIRGHAGTVVRLGVIHSGDTEEHVYNITRARIELKDSEARATIIEEGNHPDGTPYKIGVIDLPSFYMDMEAARQGSVNYKSTTRDVRRILEDFKRQDVDVVVLDLSRNGGGSLTEAIQCTGLFIDYGPVVQVKDADGRVQHYDDLDRGMAWDGPLVVMTSKFSASASEILAGAIQDYQRGIVVGDDATHGKGTVQSLLDLGSQLVRGKPNRPSMGALKITMQQFYRPNGDSTQKRGVLADVVLPSLTSHMDVGESDLDFAIDFDRVQPAGFVKYDQVNPDLIRELTARSTERRQGVEDFEKLERNIRRYKDQKERKYVTLNEEQFLAERKELDAERAEEEKIEEQMDYTTRPVFDRNFYNNEVLNVAIDYVRLMSDEKIAKLN